MAIERGQIIIEDAVLAKGFVQIPIAFLQLPDLGAGAKLAYGILLWYGWKGRGYPGHEEAAAAFGIGESSLRRYLTQLEERGLIETIQAGLGQTNSYKLPPLKLSVQGVQSERSGRSNQADNDVNKAVHTLKTNTKAPSSSQSIHNDKARLLTDLANEFAPQENPQAIVTYLGRFPAALLARAAEVVREADNTHKPIAYLYGVLQRLAEGEAAKPAAHQRADPLPELSEAEYQASLEALERVKAAMP